MLLVTDCAQSSLTSRILSMCLFHVQTSLDLTLAARVKAKIRNQDPAYPTNASLFFNGLYKGLRGDHSDVEKGFLKSGELVKVRNPVCSIFCLLNYHLFTACEVYSDVL
jgi:hypothetical protein